MDPIITLEQQAVDFARRGEFGLDARRANEELTRLTPANQGAWTRLARCCLEMGQLDEATSALDSALQINPQNTIARNLRIEVTKRRTALTAAVAVPRRRATPAPRASRANAPTAGGFTRQEFNSLGHLSPDAAVEALSPRVEALLMALNDRPFAETIVDARNRAAQSGNRLFRRNSLHASGAGHLYAIHHGGRWEPQIDVGVFAGRQWGRDSLRAGIGFNLTSNGPAADRGQGRERVLAYFDRFQRLVASAWRQLLTDWMGANGGFIQYGDRPAATDLLPKDAVAWLIDSRNALDAGWVFCGRWLFADRAEHAETLADAARLTRWMEQTFTDLLPLWTSVYRGN